MSTGLSTASISNLGTITYPGIGAYESAEMNDISGSQPGRGHIKLLTAYGLPNLTGDLTFNYNQNSVTFKNCIVDDISFEESSGGQIMVIHLLDERWAWKYAAINGRYNFRLPNNWIDPNHAATPQQLATLCFNALEVTNFDVSNLPNQSFPEVDWQYANPAQELDRLVQSLGCMIVCQRSTDKWTIQVKGVGNNLPDGVPYEDGGVGIDPQEVPDYIKVVTGPIRYQIFVPLEPIGRDVVYNGTIGRTLGWSRIQQLSYAPNSATPSAGFWDDPLNFSNIDRTRQYLNDGTQISPNELAVQSVFRTFRPGFVNRPFYLSNPRIGQNTESMTTLTVPGINQPVTLQQLILTNELVQSYTDVYGEQHRRPAFVSGAFMGNQVDNGNYPMGTRIDMQAPVSQESMDERASFSLSLDPIDTLKDIITISKPMLYLLTAAAADAENYQPATLSLCCAAMVRDPVTWQPYRYEYLYHVGSGNDTNFCHVMHQDDIQPWVIGQYPVGSITPTGYTNNQSDVNQQCLYYAKAKAAEFQLISTKTRTYIGLIPIDLDGSIQQVTYSIGNGTSTKASQGTEHSYYIPPAEDRRQQVAMLSLENYRDFWKYELERRKATSGGVST